MLFSEVMLLQSNNKYKLHKVSNKPHGLGAFLQSQSPIAVGENT